MSAPTALQRLHYLMHTGRNLPPDDFNSASEYDSVLKHRTVLKRIVLFEKYKTNIVYWGR